MQREVEKRSFVSEIIVSELVALNFLYKEENTYHRQSMSKLTVLRISRALTLIFLELNYIQSDEQIWER